MLWLNIRLFTCNAENYALAEYKSSFKNEMRIFVRGLQMYAIVTLIVNEKTGLESHSSLSINDLWHFHLCMPSEVISIMKRYLFNLLVKINAT